MLDSNANRNRKKREETPVTYYQEREQIQQTTKVIATVKGSKARGN